MNEERLTPQEEIELARLREIWRQGRAGKQQPPLSPEQLMAQVHAGRKSPALLAQAATRRQFVLSLLLLLACCLTALSAIVCNLPLLWLPVLLLGVPALWQSIGEGCRLHLYRNLNVRLLAPSTAERYAQRLSRSEERRDRRWQRLQSLRLHSTLPLQTLRFRLTGTAIACCLLIVMGTTLWHQAPPSTGRDITWGTLQCNSDCSTAQVKDNLYHLIYCA